MEETTKENHHTFNNVHPGKTLYKHFIMFMGDFVFEILSYGCTVEDI